MTDLLFDDPPAPPKPTLDLSADQADALSRLRKWAAAPSGIFTLGGLAGSGKTTLLGIFAAERRDPLPFVTFTGRASGRLRQSLEAAGVRVTTELRTKENAPDGHLCTTIHRLLYKPVIDEHEQVTGYVKRTAPDRPYRFIVIDEASMVGDHLLKDIQSLGLPILAVGDHGQLPPVRDRGSLMEHPDVRLEKIHRQAEGNPIIQFAHAVRRGGRMQKLDGIHFARRGEFPEVIRGLGDNLGARPISYMGTLCWRNKTRVTLNGVVRRAFDFKGPPREGEIMVCLKNNLSMGLFNGMRGRVMQDSKPGEKPWHLTAPMAFPEDGVSTRALTLNGAQINREETYRSIEELWERGIDEKTMGAAGLLFDFGWAMSVHKFQGSQLHTALIYLDRQEQPRSEEWRRWIYTAATRASHRLIIFQ